MDLKVMLRYRAHIFLKREKKKLKKKKKESIL